MTYRTGYHQSVVCHIPILWTDNRYDFLSLQYDGSQFKNFMYMTVQQRYDSPPKVHWMILKSGPENLWML